MANLEKDLARYGADDPCKFKLALLLAFAKREKKAYEVATSFGVSKMTIYRYARAYISEGVEGLREKPKDPPRSQTEQYE